MLPVYKLLHFLTTTAAACKDWADSSGKQHLFDMIMALIVDLPAFTRFSQETRLLTYKLILFKCRAGIVIYTTARMQVNLHLLLPEMEHLQAELLQECRTYLTTVHPGYALNLNPLRNHSTVVGSDSFTRRRFVPTHKHVSELHVVESDELIRCAEVVTPISHVIDELAEIRHYRPITKMDRADADDTLYWHRFSNGKIYTFLNPWIPEVVPVPYPTAGDMDVSLPRYVDEHFHDFIAALYPHHIDATARVVKMAWIPRRFREFCIVASKATLGISDELVRIAGKFNEGFDDARTALVQDMVNVYQLMKSALRVSDVNLVEHLCICMANSTDRECWNKWIYTSAFVVVCIDRFEKETLLMMLNAYPPFATSLLTTLYDTIGRWTRRRVMQSFVLQSCAACLDVNAMQLDSVVQETQRFERAVETSALALSTVAPTRETSAPSRRRNRRRRRGVQCKRSTEHEAHSDDDHVHVVPQDHMQLLHRIREQFALRVDLIGSGVFTNEGDVDVVVTIERDDVTLQRAYELVIEATGWRPSFERVSDDHVAVLVGQIDGVKIDAQVWRGERFATTRAERVTRSALQLSQRLTCEVDRNTLDHIRWLHRWCAATSTKGHCLCRLPGVAVTSIAIAIASQTQVDTLSLLRVFYDCTNCTAPYFNFDETLPCPSKTQDDCLVPLCVVIDSTNCANRLTLATTRHLLNVLAFSLTLGADTVLCKAVYDEWRANTMVRCVRVLPQNDSAVSQTLHVVANSFTGHPYIDTMHFEREATGSILVLCTLSHTANAEHYGFAEHDSARVDDADDDFATVTRNGRTFRLMLSPRRGGPFHGRVNVCDMIGTQEGWAYPNAPSLSLDVASRFDTRLWTVLWE